jgi:hypothetical protein
MDGATGQVIAGSLTVVANNFQGNSNQNGPSWMRTPTGQLGILYVAADGVHGAFRAAKPTSWNAFAYDYTGAPTNGLPPVLPDTLPGLYPGNPWQPPGEAATIPQYQPPCSGICFGAYNRGMLTDVKAVVAGMGYSSDNATQTPWDGFLYISACKTGTTTCSLFQSKIDGAGGLSSFVKIASTGGKSTKSAGAVTHPITGTTVLFTNETPGYVSVWEQTA